MIQETKKDDGIQTYSSIEFIDPEKLVFEKTKGGFVSMTLDGKTYPRINAYRAFPFSKPDEYISIADEEKKEIGFIRDLSQLKDEYRMLLEEELKMRYFTPKIEKVIKIKQEFGYYYWEVETDAGPRKFTVQSGQSNMKTVQDVMLLITDVDGNRYVMEDINRIDRKNMRVIGALI